MKPERQAARKAARYSLYAALLALVLTSLGGKAIAQSAYACRDLETHSGLPAVEGRDGYFFSIRPELQSHHGMAQETVDQIAELSEALRSRGTTFVLLPVPTRAQVMTEALPPMASYLGYDARNAQAVHVEMLRRLRAAGVLVADASADLRAAARRGETPMLKTDPRPSPLGVRFLANAVKDTLRRADRLRGAKTGAFAMVEDVEVTLSSDMRGQLQQACEKELPKAEAQRFGLATAAQDASDPLDRLVVLGTELTATSALGLAGFLSEATGLLGQGYGVPGGGAFAAISTYLTSDDFASNPPRVLVWEWPVTAHMGAYGPQPLVELAAAARGNCAVELNTIAENSSIRVDLADLPAGATLGLELGAPAQVARFHFESTEGHIRTRSVYRHAGQIRTGRFFLPTDDLAPEDRVKLTIETDVPPGNALRLSACL